MPSFMVILYRHAKYAGIPDETVSPWAVDAMAWAVEQEIRTYENDKLHPKAEATRAMIAKMLYAFVSVCND